MIYTAGEDGLVKAWRGPGGDGGAEVEAGGRKKRTREEREERKGRKEARARYRPY